MPYCGRHFLYVAIQCPKRQEIDEENVADEPSNAGRQGYGERGQSPLFVAEREEQPGEEEPENGRNRQEAASH